MNRTKLFIENFLAYGLINVLNKIVPLLMLPLITRMLPNTADFGRFDLFNMIIEFGSAFAVLGICDAMFREYFEKEDRDYRLKVTSTALRIVFISSFVVTIILLIFNQGFSKLFFGDFNSSSIVIMAAIGVFLATNKSIISAPTRIQNKRKIYIISGLTSSVSYYIIAILLVYLGLGSLGLIYANLLASLGILVFFFILNKKQFSFKTHDHKVAKELFKIGLPLLPVFIIYWAFNSVDKMMISNMLGISEVGIYSIGARVASISQFIYTAFAGGWQYFAFSTMKDKDQVAMTSKIFEYLGIISFLAFICLIPLNPFIFKFLFTGDYITGSVVFPYLFLSPLLLMLVQTAGSQFLVVKKSSYMTLALALGVAVNIIMNYFMIQSFGIKGCALSTLTGYMVSVVIVVMVVQRMNLLKLSKIFILIAFLMIVIIALLFFEFYLILTLVCSLCISVMIIGYRKDLKNLIALIPKIRKNSREKKDD